LFNAVTETPDFKCFNGSRFFFFVFFLFFFVVFFAGFEVF